MMIDDETAKQKAEAYRGPRTTEGSMSSPAFRFSDS